MCSRFDARGEMEMCMGFPDSSLRGFCIACAGRAAEGSDAVAKDRRGACCIEGGDANALRAGDGRTCFGAEGARNSRYGGREVVATLALLKALIGGADLLDAALLAARRQEAHILVVAGMAITTLVRLDVSE